jgi:nitroreductase
MEGRFVPLEFDELPQEAMTRRAREFYDEMNRRRTVRHFSDRPVPLEIVENAIRTAGTAPSGAHRQPWHFVLVQDPDLKARIREAAEVEERKNYDGRMPDAWIEALEPLGTDANKPFLTTCPFLVAVFAEHWRPAASGQIKNYYVQESVGIATGLLIAALHRARLVTLTHTPSPMGFLREILGRPRSERAFLLLALGYPEPACKVPDLTRKPLRDIMTVC